jgi:phosphoadenosine phosphosulfate reductase
VEEKLESKMENQQGIQSSSQTFTEEQVRALDQEFAGLTVDERLQKAFALFGSGLIATTSFGRDSGLLLHHLYRNKLPIRVFFINTTFHFPETLEYRDTLTSAYQLDLKEMLPEALDNHRYALEVANVIKISDTNACCAINKVAVQAKFLGRSDVTAFITGLRRDQAETRKLTPFVQLQKGKIKICPFADMPAEDVDMYLRLWEIPEHPLAKDGYTSIGCSPVTCTSLPVEGDTRSGRWAGQSKVECGLHTDFNL